MRRLHQGFARLAVYAGDRANYTYLITNPGNVRADNAMLTANGLASLTCNGSSTFPIASIGVDEVMLCKGSFTWVQADIESGDRLQGATLTANALTEAATVDSLTVAVPNTPTLTVTVANTTCVSPADTRE